MMTKRIPCSVTLGQPLKLEVESLAGSGYRWTITTPQTEAWKVLDFNTALDPIKGATTLVWRVMMLRVGSWNIVCRRQRPWEKEPVEERIFEISVEP